MPDAKEDLITLEKQFWQAMVDRDTEAALKLTNDPCIVAGAQGVARLSKEKFGEMMKAVTGRCTSSSCATWRSSN